MNSVETGKKANICKGLIFCLNYAEGIVMVNAEMVIAPPPNPLLTSMFSEN